MEKEELLKLTQNLVKQGKWAKAIENYEKILEMDPNDIIVLNTIGDLYIRLGRTDMAIDIFKKTAERYTKEGVFLKSIAIYKKILRIESNLHELYSKLGELYAKQGVVGEAVIQYLIYAESSYKEGKVKNAIESYQKVLALCPQNLEARLKLADIYKKQNNLDQAATEYKELAELYYNNNDLDDAKKFYLLAKELNANDYEVLKGLGQLFYIKKEYGRALAELKKILISTPDDLESIKMIANIYLDNSELDKAKQYVEKANELSPHDKCLIINLGRIHLKKKEYNLALPFYDEVCHLYLQDNDTKNACELYNEFLQNDKENIAVHRKLIDLYIRLNDDEKLLDEYQKLANIFEQKGTLDKTLNIYETILRKYPNDQACKQKFNQLYEIVYPKNDTSDKEFSAPKSSTIIDQVLSNPELPPIELNNISQRENTLPPIEKAVEENVSGSIEEIKVLSNPIITLNKDNIASLSDEIEVLSTSLDPQSESQKNVDEEIDAVQDFIDLDSNIDLNPKDTNTKIDQVLSNPELPPIDLNNISQRENTLPPIEKAVEKNVSGSIEEIKVLSNPII
ncbi:MAG: tetratricopeptide repeat protein, partial [bacterium]